MQTKQFPKFIKKIIFLSILTMIFGIGVFVVTAVNNRGSAPVAYWKFDEGAGPTAYDSAGSNDGTITNAAWRNEPDCLSGKCLYFDGTTDYIDVGNITGTIKTISFWMRLKDTSTQKIIDIDGADYIEIDGSNQISTQSFPGTTAYYVNAVNTQAISANSWQFIVITDTTGVSPTDFDIGVHDLGGTPSYFTGYLDDIKIYNYARSSAQIRAEFVAGTASRGSAIAVQSTQQQRNASEGLLGHWKMDESSGNATDSSGSSLTLTNNNTVPFVAGKYANAADFTPASSHNFSTATSVSNVKTIAFWTYPDNSTNNYFDLASGVYLISSSGTLTATGFTSPVIYVNGVQSSIISASAWSHIAVVTNTGVTSNAIAFGKANSAYFDGKLDDIKIYNTARSAEQIMMDYEIGPPPVAHWKMDEKTGTIAYDTSGSTNGTLTSGPTWTTGKYGSSVKFDGSDDFIDVGAGPITINTVSFWVYPATTTEYPIDLNGTAYIWINAGTITAQGFTSPTIYVNGIVSSIAVANQWQYITVTTGTALNASDLDIGRIEGVGNHEGKIDDVRIYNYARTQKQIISDMSGGRPPLSSPPYQGGAGGVVGYWDFNESQGTVAFDKSSNNNDGTITGADWTMNGKFGGALDFVSANSDYVEIAVSSGGSLDFSGDSAISVSAWIRPDSVPNSNPQVVDNQSGNFELAITSSNNVSFGVYTSAWIGSGSSGTNSVPMGSWSHVVGVYDGSKVRIYVNGVEKNSASISGALYSVVKNIRIGKYHDAGCSATSCVFDGLIDEVKIYPFALTPSEIKQEYNSGKAMVLGSPRNSASTWDDGGFGGAAPVAWWKMDEKTDNTCSGGVNDVCDVSGNGNNGANTGGPVWKGAGLCAVGACLSFDGTDDYVSMGDVLDVGTNDFSISCWIKTTATSDKYIITKRDDSVSTNKGYAIYASATGKFGRVFGDGSLDRVLQVGTTTINNGGWHHISVVFDRDGNMTGYVDGVNDGSTVISAQTGDASNAYNFLVGQVHNLAAGLYFNGLIDDVRIYNYARTAAQIAWDYNRGKPKLHWKFDENTGATAYDYYKTKNGDLTGHSPDWTGAADQCKFNYCLDFTPANLDYVDVGNTGIGTNLQAVSFWIYPDSVVSQNIIDFDAGTHKITTDASGNLTATGFSSPTYYKNGIAIASPVLTASTWQNIMITTATAFSPSDVDFGRVAANYFDGKLDEIKFYTYPLTAAQVKMDYQGGAVRMGPGEGLP